MFQKHFFKPYVPFVFFGMLASSNVFAVTLEELAEQRKTLRMTFTHNHILVTGCSWPNLQRQSTNGPVHLTWISPRLQPAKSLAWV